MEKNLFDLQLFADEDTEDKSADNDDTSKKDDSEKENKPEPKYTDEDLDRIIQEKKAKWDKQAKEAEEEAKKLAKMNAQQKAEHERDKLQKELDKLRGEKARADMAKEARRMCADANINVSDDILSSIITSDADTTKEAVESFIELFKSEVEKAVKEAAEYEAQDKKRKEAIDTRNDADSFVFQTQQALEQVGDKLDAADKSAVEADLNALKALVDANPEPENMTESTVNEMKAAKEKLMESAQKVFAKMYEGAQAAGAGPDMGAGAGPDMGAGAGASAADDDVVDADFKEV